MIFGMVHGRTAVDDLIGGAKAKRCRHPAMRIAGPAPRRRERWLAQRQILFAGAADEDAHLPPPGSARRRRSRASRRLVSSSLTMPAPARPGSRHPQDSLFGPHRTLKRLGRSSLGLSDVRVQAIFGPVCYSNSLIDPNIPFNMPLFFLHLQGKFSLKNCEMTHDTLY